MIINTRPFGTAEFIETQPNWFALEQPYLDFLTHIYNNGVDKMDRTGTGARSIFGYMMRFNLMRGLPLLTTKLVPRKTVFDELKFFLEGSTNNERLREINQMHSKLDWSNRDTIWSEWVKDDKGNLGPIYSDQWRNFRGRAISVKDSATQFEVINDQNILNIIQDDDVLYEGFDQIADIMHLLKNSPDSRRILVSAWNPTLTHKMALPPCHVLFQFWTRPATWHERRASLNKFYGHVGHDNKIDDEYFDSLNIPSRVLSCQMYQRSADSFLGVPFNIVSYSMLTEMIAHQMGMMAGEFIWVGGDCHIYSNHFEQVLEQLSRSPKEETPQLRFKRKPASIFEYDWLDLDISNYDPHPAIEAPVAV